MSQQNLVHPQCALPTIELLMRALKNTNITPNPNSALSHSMAPASSNTTPRQVGLCVANVPEANSQPCTALPSLCQALLHLSAACMTFRVVTSACALTVAALLAPDSSCCS